jgi:phage antirepressor YoqD-like protein/biotin operon repressor
MNEVSIESYVSVKALAEILDVSEATIKRAVEKVRSLLGGVETNSQGGYLLNEEQATIVKNEIAKHHNLQSRQIDSVSTELEENQIIASAMAILQARNEELKRQNEKLLPAANFAYQLCSSKDTIEIGECAKVLNKNIGRNRLFEFLRNSNVLQSNNIPYQKYIDAGYFRVIESKYVTPNGETKISLKTVVFQKGVAYINKLLSKAVENA